MYYRWNIDINAALDIASRSKDVALKTKDHDDLALAESMLRNSRDPIEQMRRAELIPLGRALYAFAESVQSSWLLDSKQIETQLRAARYHEASVALVYGRAPWRILPTAVQARLAKKRLKPDLIELLADCLIQLRHTMAVDVTPQ